MAGSAFFQDDLDNGAFFDTDDFAYVATYTPAGGQAKSVNGQYFDLNLRINPFSGDFETNTDALFVCAKSDVPNAKQNDLITVDATNFKVKIVDSSTNLKIARLGINRA